VVHTPELTSTVHVEGDVLVSPAPAVCAGRLDEEVSDGLANGMGGVDGLPGQVGELGLVG
jgi:hypothetical protein